MKLEERSIFCSEIHARKLNSKITEPFVQKTVVSKC